MKQAKKSLSWLFLWVVKEDGMGSVQPKTCVFAWIETMMNAKVWLVDWKVKQSGTNDVKTLNLIYSNVLHFRV